jgi:isopentenyl-diphosphate delta-isomerase
MGASQTSATETRPDSDRVILVDANDRPIGEQDKQAAHREGRLHRAVSVFLVNRTGHWLLQRRAPAKYHSGGLWSNTCCGHPRPGETTLAAAQRRLREELGIDAALRPVMQFQYRAELSNGLIEHELDHVFTGRFDGEPVPNLDEVVACAWLDPKALAEEISQNPDRFTAWLQLLFPHVRLVLQPPNGGP